MKRFTMILLAAALLRVPAVALARHGGDDEPRRQDVRGTITAYDADTGDLTITTRKGRAITALVTEDTRIRCSDHRSASVLAPWRRR